jgi:hypothetical protein
LIETSAIDIAVLDYRLESETISPVADRLSTQGIPYLFYTSSRSHVEQAHPGVPILDKPTRPEQLVVALKVDRKPIARWACPALRIMVFSDARL